MIPKSIEEYLFMAISWRKAFFKISKFQKFLFNENFQKILKLFEKIFFGQGTK